MKHGGELLLLVGVLGLSGCSSEECEDCLVECNPTLLLGNPPGMVLTGQPAKVAFFRVESDVAPCNTRPREPLSATSEVTGPDGQLIESTVFFDGPDDTPTLQFIPERPGPYHLLVLFSPSGGLHQFDVDAALDVPPDAPTVTLPRGCQSVERTSHGAWVCDSAVYREGTLVEQFDGARLAVSGDVLWVLQETQLRRYVDSGTELTLTASLDLPRDGIEFLLPSADELLVLHTSTFIRYSFEAGTLRASNPATWFGLDGMLEPRPPRGLLLREGSTTALLSIAPNGTLQACAYRLTAWGPYPQTGDCQKLYQHLVGFEPSAVWFSNVLPSFSAPTLSRWVWSGGKLSQQEWKVLDSRNQLMTQLLRGRNTALPMVRVTQSPTSLTAALSVSPSLQTLTFERMDLGVEMPYASPSLSWMRSLPEPSTATRIRVRSSSP